MGQRAARGDAVVGVPGARRLVAVAVLTVAALTMAVLLHPGPLPGEVGYIAALQSLGAPVPRLARIVRWVTSTEAALLVGAVAAGLVSQRGDRRARTAVVVAAAAMLAVQPVSKELIDRPRPTAEQVDVRAGYESTSFPSGHSLSTTTVWGAFALRARRRRRDGRAILALVPVVATFLSGGIDGVHWPSDALAGTLLGALAALAVDHLLGSAERVPGTISALRRPGWWRPSRR